MLKIIIQTIISVALPLMGIIGYFYGNNIFLYIASIVIAAEAIIGLITGELKSLFTYILEIIIGLIIALIIHSDIWHTILLTLCFVELILEICSIIGMIISCHYWNK